MVEVNWDWLMIYSVTFIDPYSGQILETIDFGSPAFYYLYFVDKITIGIQYDGPLSWPTFQILSPNGGEILISGEDFLITWTNSFLPPQKLWYSSDAGINWSIITDNIQYPYNSFIWQVPQLNSDSCLVRVGYFPCAYDVSNNFFSITFPVSVETEKELPTKFSLSQNYPNPFNPTTNIEFRIADFGFVSLKVYDVLGNEIATLVNEKKPAGEYEVEFDASNLPSGIYFYQLKAGSFTETKKMILLK
ncbi:MAG: T9SS type A sorting domain-containing protein [Ignavibacteriaceae bacterium]|nr:T9SS type A sorting domain-containing protein [Ignavibacteriaceae bacterium]